MYVHIVNMPFCGRHLRFHLLEQSPHGVVFDWILVEHRRHQST